MIKHPNNDMLVEAAGVWLSLLIGAAVFAISFKLAVAIGLGSHGTLWASVICLFLALTALRRAGLPLRRYWNRADGLSWSLGKDPARRSVLHSGGAPPMSEGVPTQGDAFREIASGDELARDQLYRDAELRILPSLRRILAPLGEAESEARSVLDETVTEFVKRIGRGQVDPNRNWWGLLYVACHRRAIDYLRREGRRRDAEQSWASQQTAQPIGSPEAALARSEQYRALREALETLQVRDREVVVGKYLVGRTQRELAQEYGVSEAAVSVWLARVRHKLRNALAEQV
jgi:RNA polymerase sigma factor (sigma-70 family)